MAMRKRKEVKITKDQIEIAKLEFFARGGKVTKITEQDVHDAPVLFKYLNMDHEGVNEKVYS